MKEITKSSMSVEDLRMYIQDLKKMGFVCEHQGNEGVPSYKLTELGRRSGLQITKNLILQDQN